MDLTSENTDTNETTDINESNESNENTDTKFKLFLISFTNQ